MRGSGSEPVVGPGPDHSVRAWGPPEEGPSGRRGCPLGVALKTTGCLRKALEVKSAGFGGGSRDRIVEDSSGLPGLVA